MNIVRAIPRPTPQSATLWNGSNKAELESYYSEVFNTTVTFTVDGTELVRDGWPFTDTGNVPEGYWFSHERLGSVSDQEFMAVYQIVSGDGLLKYGLSED